jgi:hypothetical protein
MILVYLINLEFGKSNFVPPADPQLCSSLSTSNESLIQYAYKLIYVGINNSRELKRKDRYKL